MEGAVNQLKDFFVDPTPILEFDFAKNQVIIPKNKQGTKRSKEYSNGYAPALVGNVGVVSCRRTPPNNMLSGDMQTCRENVENVGPTRRQILSSGPCQAT